MRVPQGALGFTDLVRVPKRFCIFSLWCEKERNNRPLSVHRGNVFHHGKSHGFMVPRDIRKKEQFLAPGVFLSFHDVLSSYFGACSTVNRPFTFFHLSLCFCSTISLALPSRFHFSMSIIDLSYAKVADSKATPSGEKDVSSSPPFVFTYAGLDWKYEWEWHTRVASRMSIDLSHVKVSWRIGDSTILELGFSLVSWLEYLRNVGGDRGPLRVMHSDGVGFLIPGVGGYGGTSKGLSEWFQRFILTRKIISFFLYPAFLPSATLGAVEEETRRKGKRMDTAVGDDADELEDGATKKKKKTTGDLEPNSSFGSQCSQWHSIAFLQATSESATKEAGRLKEVFGDVIRPRVPGTDGQLLPKNGFTDLLRRIVEAEDEARGKANDETWAKVEEAARGRFVDNSPVKEGNVDVLPISEGVVKDKCVEGGSTDVAGSAPSSAP
ncbi:uncharacterized protein G2W53_003866 [Senna tora]|uniref:Uncharacterized protein n=1 Tax=Senna tora TaxID=362788 RepID=A0A834X9F7_9FABA|nr:uncharacterized protein G2W53_003866 [Senna tora]